MACVSLVTGLFLGWNWVVVSARRPIFCNGMVLELCASLFVMEFIINQGEMRWDSPNQIVMWCHVPCYVTANNGFGPIPWKNDYQYYSYLNSFEWMLNEPRMHATVCEMDFLLKWIGQEIPTRFPVLKWWIDKPEQTKGLTLLCMDFV